MCLAVPMEVVSVTDNVCEVETGGVRQQVRLDLMPDRPAPGDYIMVHAGVALQRLDREEALETIKLFQEVLRLANS